MIERRLFPRIGCSFPVYDISFDYIGNAIDISFGSMQVESTFLTNESINSERFILFFLNDKKKLIKTRATTLRIRDIGSGRNLITYSFIEFSPGSSELINDYVTSHLWKNVFTAIDKESGVNEGYFSKILEKEEIINILLEALKTKTPFYCVQDEQKRIQQLILQDVEHNNLLFKVDNRFIEPQIVDSHEIYFCVTLGHSSYLIFSDNPTIKGQNLAIPMPEILYACVRRSDKREDVSCKDVSIIIPLPYPPGAILRRKVIDMSNNGLAFHNPLNEFYFLPGTPIGSLKVLAGKKKFVANGEIRHITPVLKKGKEAFLKVGVFFPEKKASFLTGTVKSPQHSSTSRFVKTGGGFFKDMMHCMKGLAVQAIYLAQKGMAANSFNQRKTPSVDIIRTKNRKNEEIVGILNTTWDTKEKKNAHTIIIPPAFGRRKESTGPLALAIIENFKRVGMDLAVIRFDGIRNLGESFKDTIYRQSGREAVGMTLSQACDDLKTIVDFSKNNERFICEKLVLLTFSISSVPTMRLLANNDLGHVDLWIAGMGASCTQEVVKNASGGIDYLNNHLQKIPSGETTFIGITIDQPNFCQDAIENKMAFLDDSIAYMKQISTQVEWILGEYDGWTDVEKVKTLLDFHKTKNASLHLLKMGHTPMNGLDALKLFKVIIGMLSKSLMQKEITPIFPLPSQLDDIRIREWDRAPKYPITDPEKYWSGYLLGENDEDEGYDTLWLCDDYVDFLDEQRKALCAEAGHKVADMGCGTGNFGELLIKNYLDSHGPLPDLTVVDLVSKALDRAKYKYKKLLKNIDNYSITFKQCDLEINRLIPIKQFLDGEFYCLDKFKSKITGLYDDTIELWKQHYSEILHQILRGKPIGHNESRYLKETFANEEISIIHDMNLAARYLAGKLTDKDICETANDKKKEITTKMLRFEILDFMDSNLNFNIPFCNNQFDRILCSIVLSYLKNPATTFAEFVRCLKPGGRLVVSTMKPDTDMSIMYTKLIKKIEDSNQYPKSEKARILESVRKLSNSVALLLTLVEECEFRFFSKEEMLTFANENNLKEVTITESYGNPAQAYILSGVK